METKLKMIVSDLFDLPQDQVSDLASPRTIAGWDSIRHVELIMACEQEFGIYFTPAELPKLSDLPSIKTVIEAKV